MGSVDGEDDWWTVAKPAIEARMSRYSATETHFALLSIGEKRLPLLESELASITERLSAIELAVNTGEGKSTTLSDGFVIAEDEDGLEVQRETTLFAIENLRTELADEALKLKRQAAENVRRRHNYVPFAITIMRHLAAQGKLMPMITAAEQKRAASTGVKA